MHILHTVPYTFPKVLTGRICLTIHNFFSRWSFPLFSWPECVLQGWYCEEKLDAGHYKGSKDWVDKHGGLSFEPRRRRSILFLVLPAVFLFTYILMEVSYLITKNKHGSFKQTHSNTPAVEGPKRLFQFLPRELSPLQQLHSLHLYGKGYIGQIKLIFLFSCQRFLYKHNRFITARTRFPWG